MSASKIVACLASLVWIIALVQAHVCPPNFTRVGEKCYSANLTKVPWYVADRSCRARGANLFVLDNQADLTALTAYLRSVGVPFANSWRDSVWVGINALGNNRRFVLSNNGAAIPYAIWSPRQPDNASPPEDCVAYANYNGFGYHDIECRFLFSFVCETRVTHKEHFMCLREEQFVEVLLDVHN